MTRIRVWHGSIGDADVDVIVNASNTQLRLGSGVSAAVAASCGAGFQARLTALREERWPGGMEPGDVVLTDANAHPRAKHVAHVAVMDYRDRPDARPRPDDVRIERGCTELWRQLAALPAPVSVGMVALGAGTGGMGLRDSVSIACRALARQLEADAGAINEVVFVAYDGLEFVNTLAAVRDHFDVDLAGIDPDALRMLEVLK